MMAIIEQAFRAIQGAPGIGSNGLAKKLGLPSCSARRAVKTLVREERVSITGDRLTGYRYWARGAVRQLESAAEARLRRVENESSEIRPKPAGDIVDFPFREVSAPASHSSPAARLPSGEGGRDPSGNSGHRITFAPRSAGGAVGSKRVLAARSSTSRELVPAVQPFDSRTSDALARIAARRGGRPGGASLNPQTAEAWNLLFLADPGEDEVLNHLAASWREKVAHERAAEAREARAHAAMEHDRQTAAKAAEDARIAEIDRAAWMAALSAVSQMGRGEGPKPAGTVSDGAMEKRVIGSRMERVPSTRSVADFFIKSRQPAAKTFWGKLFSTPAKSRWK